MSDDDTIFLEVKPNPAAMQALIDHDKICQRCHLAKGPETMCDEGKRLYQVSLDTVEVVQIEPE